MMGGVAAAVALAVEMVHSPSADLGPVCKPSLRGQNASNSELAVRPPVSLVPDVSRIEVEPVTITGRVLRAADLSPLPNARVSLRGPNRDERESAESSSDGGFSLKLEPGSRKDASLSIFWINPLVVVKSKTTVQYEARVDELLSRTKLEVVLDTGWTLQVNVRCPDDSPAQRVFVEVPFVERRRMVDNNGEVVFRDLPYGSSNIRIEAAYRTGGRKICSQAVYLAEPPREPAVMTTVVMLDCCPLPK